ncbi:MAG: protein kinase [Anaerolineae bacterium]|nr:protein kinase [Anaerolineae bacterium]
MEELIGQSLGQYRIVEIIGQGGMATVFRARQPGLERWVAVKVLPPHYAADPHFSAHFLREAQAIAQLEHPHILPVYDFGQQGRYIYLVMRYIEGSRTLADIMPQPLAFKQMLGYLDQVAAALDYAHERGIVHRDIKPTNILLNQNWVFLADFGLARLTQAGASPTITDVALGTPAYMSPEQGRGAKVDARTDIYALGVIVYEMLTGEIPHGAESSQAILYRRNHEAPPLLQVYRPEIPPLLDQIVQKALALDPAARFQSAGALVKALRQGVPEPQASQLLTAVVPDRSVFWPPSSPPVSPLPPPADAPSPPAARLNWLWGAIAGLTAVIVLGLLLVGALWLRNRPVEADPTRAGGQAPAPDTPSPTQVANLPATATALPPATPTAPAQNCSAGAGGPFAEVWPEYRDRLGCPAGDPETLSTIAEEAFQGGHLFWSRNTDQVYIVYDRRKDGTELTEGQWQLVPPEWKWDGSNPEGVGLTPPPGLVEPKRGFGWLWRTHLGGAEGPLGWALDREYGFDNLGQVQQFEQGLMFKGSASRIYVLLNNGQFYIE